MGTEARDVRVAMKWEQHDHGLKSSVFVSCDSQQF